MRLAAYLNRLNENRAKEALLRCCGAKRWVAAMLNARPFASDQALYDRAEQAWWDLDAEAWLEAFSHHPRIGERKIQQPRFAKTAEWSKNEQASTEKAEAAVLQALEDGNQAYEERFGHVFLICATGRSAEEMLAELESRLKNLADSELRVAAGEQAKITRLRLDKLVDELGD